MAALWPGPVLHQPPHQDAKAGKEDAGLFLCWFFTCPPHADWELSLAELLQVSAGQRWHFCREHTRVRTAQDRLGQWEGISAEVLLLCHSFSWGELHRFSRLALGLGLFSWLEAGWGCSVCSGQRHHHALQLRQSFNLLPSASHSHLCNVPNILPRVNFGALDKKCPTVQSKVKTWHLTAELLAQETGCQLCRYLQDGSVLSPGAGQKVSTTGLKNSDSLSFFPFTLKSFMIYCRFIPFMVQKERSWGEFQLWDIPRNHLLPQPGGTLDFTCYCNASMKLKTARAPTFTMQIVQHQATHASLLETAGPSPASALWLPPLTGALLQRCCRPFTSGEASPGN